jgi:hypothetical protein
MTDETPYLKNPLTQRMVKKDENSRTYKKLLKDGVIEGTPIPSKKKVKKEYKFKIRDSNDLVEEKINEKPRVLDDNELTEYTEYEEIDEDEIINVISEYLKNKKK